MWWGPDTWYPSVQHTSGPLVKVKKILLPVLQAETPKQDDFSFQMLLPVWNVLVHLTSDANHTQAKSHSLSVVHRKDELTMCVHTVMPQKGLLVPCHNLNIEFFQRSKCLISMSCDKERKSPAVFAHLSCTCVTLLQFLLNTYWQCAVQVNFTSAVSHSSLVKQTQHLL